MDFQAHFTLIGMALLALASSSRCFAECGSDQPGELLQANMTNTAAQVTTTANAVSTEAEDQIEAAKTYLDTIGNVKHVPQADRPPDFACAKAPSHPKFDQNVAAQQAAKMKTLADDVNQPAEVRIKSYVVESKILGMIAVQQGLGGGAEGKTAYGELEKALAVDPKSAAYKSAVLAYAEMVYKLQQQGSFTRSLAANAIGLNLSFATKDAVAKLQEISGPACLIAGIEK
jgi:hypothetical protein